MTWERLPVNKHFWAFFYYCKRRGDHVTLRRYADGTADLTINRA